MSETIIVALITFASGVLGASIGAVVTYRTTKLSSQEELRKLQREEKRKCYLSFMEAYNSFFTCLVSIEVHFGTEISPDEEIARYKQFQYSCMAVTLVGSDSVLSVLQKLQLAMNQYGQSRMLPKNINQLYTALVEEMRKDLNSSIKHRVP